VQLDRVIFEMAKELEVTASSCHQQQLLWAWGANSWGQLGTGDRCEQHEVPQKVDLLSALESKEEEVIQVAGGGTHTLLLTRDSRSAQSRLYVAGSNAKGQLGLDKSEKPFSTTFLPIQVQVSVGDSPIQNVCHVSAGWDFSFVVTQSGEVYASGSNAFGQLGLGSEIKEVSKFTKVEFGEEFYSRTCGIISKVECGMRHAVFLTSDGEVYATGCNKKGQLGLGTGVKRVAKPTKVPLKYSAVSVSCGQNFTLVLPSVITILYGFGDNKYRQLESGADQVFDPVPVPVGLEAREISCGWTHTLCLTEDGVVMSRGRNSYGQLGWQCETENHFVFVKISAKIAKVSSGYEHGLAVTKDGELFVWGWNEHGNCGLNGTENVNPPQKLNIDIDSSISKGQKHQHVENCYAGSGHSFCTTRTK